MYEVAENLRLGRGFKRHPRKQPAAEFDRSLSLEGQTHCESDCWPLTADRHQIGAWEVGKHLRRKERNRKLLEMLEKDYWLTNYLDCWLRIASMRLTASYQSGSLKMSARVTGELVRLPFWRSTAISNKWDLTRGKGLGYALKDRWSSPVRSWPALSGTSSRERWGQMWCESERVRVWHKPNILTRPYEVIIARDHQVGRVIIYLRQWWQ